MSKKNIAERKLSFNTRAVHVGQEQADPASGARAVPIYQSTAFVLRRWHIREIISSAQEISTAEPTIS